MKVEADIINGVYIVAFFENDTEVLEQEVFYESLSNHQEGTIGAVIDKSMYLKISDEYGIH